MSFVTDEMRNFVKTISRGIVASIDETGYPHVAVKNGKLRKEGLLELWSVFGEQTLSNVKRNPNVCVVFADFDKAWGYRFKGKGSLITSGDRFEKVKGNLAKAGWTLQALINIDVRDVTLISQKPEEINKHV